MQRSAKLLFLAEPQQDQCAFVAEIIHQNYPRWALFEVTSERVFHQTLREHDEFVLAIIPANISWADADEVVRDIQRRCFSCRILIIAPSNELKLVKPGLLRRVDECIFAFGKPELDCEIVHAAFRRMAKYINAVLEESVPGQSTCDLPLEHVIDREQHLRSRETAFWHIFESAPVGLAILSSSGRFVDVNRAFENFVEFRADELRHKAFWEVVFSDDLEENRSLFQELLEGRHDYIQMEKRYVRRDKSTVWGRMLGTMLPQDDDTQYFLSIVADISREKELEEIRRHDEQLQVMGHLAGTIAHDFNNVLALIKGYSQLGLNAGENDALIQQSFQKVLEASERGISLISQILRFTRRKTGSAVLLDLNEFVQDMENSLENLVGGGIEVHLELHTDAAKIHIAPEALEQIILNLVMNAKGAMNGHGVLTIRTQSLSPELMHESPWELSGEEKRYVGLTLTDTGEGMSPELQSRIFEPFFTTKVLGIGTGLGLASVLSYVRQSGGHIALESKVGQGTTFYLAFPQY